MYYDYGGLRMRRQKVSDALFDLYEEEIRKDNLTVWKEKGLRERSYGSSFWTLLICRYQAWQDRMPEPMHRIRWVKPIQPDSYCICCWG